MRSASYACNGMACFYCRRSASTAGFFRATGQARAPRHRLTRYLLLTRRKEYGLTVIRLCRVVSVYKASARQAAFLRGLENVV